MIFFALSDCVDSWVCSFALFLALEQDINLLNSHRFGVLVWWETRLFGELSAQKFFIIYTAIIFGGQGGGFIFGYSSGNVAPPDL